MRWRFLVAAALIAASSALWPVATSGVGRPGITPVACPQQTWQPADPAFDALPGAKAHFGNYDGGVYRIEIPDRWNGELMLSAHGFTTNAGPRGSELRVGAPLIREHLVQEGFAWAASSYRCNGYVPGIGLQDTMALTDLFTKFNGGHAPQRVYLTGGSMGGHVTLLGMHEFPTSFAGGLAMCPSGPELFDYFSSVGAAAEVITGLRFDQPTGVADTVKKMSEMLGTPPGYTTKGLQLASVEIQLSGGPRPFAMEGLKSRFLQNISGGALAGSTSPSNRAVSTLNVKYSIDESLGLTADHLNTAARRKAPDMTVRGPMGPFDELVPFDGRIQRPLLTMHGTGDLYVPIHLERALKRAVTDSKRDDLLVQRIYRIAGHCGFNADEQARSFDDLVAWVRNGVKPKGDDVMGDLHDAGRTFTSPLRDGDPGAVTVTSTLSTRQ
jgi:pimeloyl-ACP methyl ester carboxylesterase